MLALNRLFNRPPTPSDAELAAYAEIVVPVLERAERLYAQWLEQAALFVASEKLANAAAIHRWQVATMKQAVEGVTPPAALASAHAALIDALRAASRAAQLLSGGSRFHNAGALCDGYVLLEEARRQRLAAERDIRRLLGPIVGRADDRAEDPGPEPGRPESGAAGPAPTEADPA